nr:hypothetical protein [Suid alphaherpesvirus 1]
MIFGEASVCTSFACSPHVAALGQWGLTVQASVCLHVVRMCCGGLSVFCGGLCVVWWSLSVLWWSLCCVVVSPPPPATRETPETPVSPSPRPLRPPATPAVAPPAPARSARAPRAPPAGRRDERNRRRTGDRRPDPNREATPGRENRTRTSSPDPPGPGREEPDSHALDTFVAHPPPSTSLSRSPLPPHETRPRVKKNKSCSRCTVFRLVSSFRGTSGGREGARDRLGLVGGEGVGGEGSQDGGGAWRGVAEGRGGSERGPRPVGGRVQRGGAQKWTSGRDPGGAPGDEEGRAPFPAGRAGPARRDAPPGERVSPRGRRVPPRAPGGARASVAPAGRGGARPPPPRGVRDGGAQNRAGGRRGGLLRRSAGVSVCVCAGREGSLSLSEGRAGGGLGGRMVGRTGRAGRVSSVCLCAGRV